MTRVLPALCLACLLTGARPAAPQQLQPPNAQARPAADTAPQDPAAEAPPADASTPLVRLLNQRSAKYVVEGNVMRLTGSVELEPPNSMVKFFADEVVIYFDENRLEARGNVVFSEPEGRIAAERVEFDLGTGTGTFYDASGIMAMGKFADPRQFAGQDPDLYFYGEKIEKLPNRKYRITKGAFTTCVQPAPRWELTSGSVSITLDDYAYARNTVNCEVDKDGVAQCKGSQPGDKRSYNVQIGR